MLGPGKYDKELSEALRKIGAKSGLLIVIDGTNGPSFCCQATIQTLLGLPQALRSMADQIDGDLKKGKL